jgi:hypothetical protein
VGQVHIALLRLNYPSAYSLHRETIENSFFRDNRQKLVPRAAARIQKSIWDPARSSNMSGRNDLLAKYE